MLCVEAFQFLIYECLKRGRVRSENTWWTYAGHLSQYLSFCEQNNLDWRDISETSEDEMLVGAYRDLCVSEFGMSVNTTNQHLREGANKRGNSSRLTQSFHFFLFEPFFLP